MDRSLTKFCALPCFPPEFHEVLEDLGLLTIEVLLAFDAGSGEQFANAVVVMAPTLLGGKDPSSLKADLAKIAKLADRLGLLWTLVSSTKQSLLKDSARSYGFCQAAPSVPRPSLQPAQVPKKPRVMVAPSELNVPRKYSVQGEASCSLTPLMERELLLKSKWIQRLEAILAAAGSAALFNAEVPVGDALTAEERTKLKRLVLAVGAFRTLSTHVRHWERFAAWAARHSWSVYPPTIDVILKYLLYLDSIECGPTVIPSVRAAISWLGARVQMAVPKTDTAEIRAVELKVIELRAKEVKEAIPLPLDLVRALELFFHEVAERQPHLAIFVGWVLCLIFASLRFNDGLHVKPSSLEFRDGVLYGLCWQTKVDRKRRGTRFAIAAVGLIGNDEIADDGFVRRPWLEIFWGLFLAHADGERDFWIWELEGLDQFGSAPMSWHRGLKFFHVILAKSVQLGNFAVDRKLALAQLIPTVTWHSCRVTLINAAVHAGVDALPISMQANHANTDLVVKYTRDRRTVPLQMVGKLLGDLRKEWAPPPPRGEAVPVADEFSDDEEEVVPVFYVKHCTATARRIITQKFHVTAADDHSQLACNKLALTDCEPVGSDLPDLDVLCKACRKSRPDLWPI